jgi:hypothetical protein
VVGEIIGGHSKYEGKKLSAEDEKNYNSLVSRINDAIKKPQFANGAFIKLSTRRYLK